MFCVWEEERKKLSFLNYFIYLSIYVFLLSIQWIWGKEKIHYLFNLFIYIFYLYPLSIYFHYLLIFYLFPQFIHLPIYFPWFTYFFLFIYLFISCIWGKDRSLFYLFILSVSFFFLEIIASYRSLFYFAKLFPFSILSLMFDMIKMYRRKTINGK